EVRMIGSAAGAGPQRQDQMAVRVNPDADLRQTLDRLGSPGFTPSLTILGLHSLSGLMAALLIMPADVMRLVQARIDRQWFAAGQLPQQLGRRRPLPQRVQQAG